MNEPEPVFECHEGDGPLVAAAVHDGHALRDEVAAIMALSDLGRLREEDPFTGGWTAIAPTRIIGRRSRFEVDLNRPRAKAFYRRPEDAWGLDLWTTEPADDLVDRSLAQYDAFYARAMALLAEIEARHGRFVVFDLHTYNHRRDGADGPVADRARWAPVIDRVIADLGAFDFQVPRSMNRSDSLGYGGRDMCYSGAWAPG